MTAPLVDKAVLGFIADILYIQGVINFDMLDGINEMRTHEDMGKFIEKMLRGDFNAYRTGEHYTTLAD